MTFHICVKPCNHQPGEIEKICIFSEDSLVKQLLEILPRHLNYESHGSGQLIYFFSVIFPNLTELKTLSSASINEIQVGSAVEARKE